MNQWMQMNFQDPISPNMEAMIYFHDFLNMILIMIMMIILYNYTYIMFNKFVFRYLIHGHLMELIWTIIPIFILIVIAIPSMKILYFTEDIFLPLMTVKIIGNQWFWVTEYQDMIINKSFNNPLSIEMYMTSSMKKNTFRLLETDEHMVLPVNSFIRLITTSEDVIHSFSMPSMGIKIDSIPGRLNQSFLFSSQAGMFFGQCSEICGLGHSFMPITIEFVDKESFLNWLIYKMENF